MFEKLKNLFKGKPKKEEPVCCDCDDPFMAQVIMTCFQTGKPVYGTRYKNGKTKIEVLSEIDKN